MEYTFFWISIAAGLIIFAATVLIKGFNPALSIIAITSVAYSLIFDITLGELSGLYYYITPSWSLLYILLGALLLYTPLNLVYCAFAPADFRKHLVYTFFWIILMLVFEYFSLLTRTVVLTGWQPMPWSIVTYIVTYAWISALYRYLNPRLPVLTEAP